MNGYVNGGSENGDRQNEESDDEDSNPLEDLEALGEKEEQENQIREDEEGMRNAKELARQGWEDSLKTPQAPQLEPMFGEQGTVDDAVVNIQGEHAAPAAVDQTVETSDGAKTASNGATHYSYDPVHDHSADSRLDLEPNHEIHVPQATAKADSGDEMSASHGGFRAVNDSTNDGGNVITGANGWRAI